MNYRVNKHVRCRIGNAIAIIFLISIVTCRSVSQIQWVGIGEDPCGYPDTASAEYKLASALNWGYSYDSLKTDLARWSQSPFVAIDSVGATVQNRAMYMLTIQDTASPTLARKRVWIHARTHPNEVQGTWVTNELIKHLLSSSLLAQRLRDSCVFNIMPMYNPDGVELARPRENANNIDIESNWSAASPQPEVQVLRRVFVQLMGQSNPIRVALNMHSAYACRRYFVYHTAAGTSGSFATMQQNFISSVRNSFPGAIEPYTYFVSWPSAPPPTYYPESWFWYNHREAVLAQTYEDKNCASAGGFDSTARAILQGIGAFLGVAGPASVSRYEEQPAPFSLQQNYPNPFNPSTTIRFDLRQAGFVSLKVFDALGKEVSTLVSSSLPSGRYETTFDASSLASGVYVYRLQAGNFINTKRMVVLR